ncbi:MAG: hypothetical protein ACI4TF_11215 [Oliverpabstia sp.]
MKIIKLRTYYLENPIGYEMNPVTLSYQVSEARGTKSTAQNMTFVIRKSLHCASLQKNNE